MRDYNNIIIIHLSAHSTAVAHCLKPTSYQEIGQTLGFTWQIVFCVGVYRLDLECAGTVNLFIPGYCSTHLLLLTLITIHFKAFGILYGEGLDQYKPN